MSPRAGSHPVPGVCYLPAPMSPARKSTKKTTRKSASAGRAKKTTARKGAAKKKTTARRATTKQTTKKASAKKSTARKKTPARKASPKKTTAKKTPARVAKTAAPRKTPAPRPSASRPRVRAAKLDKKALAAVRKTLEDQRADLLRQQSELQEDSFDSTQSDMTGEAGFDEDFADAGTATFDRERDLSIRNNIQDLVEQITRAIGRIDDGTYGTCERCGRPIDAARLKALPHALLCMDCKRREERAR
jgi:RNA polymerase-binding protein DksA